MSLFCYCRKTYEFELGVHITSVLCPGFNFVWIGVSSLPSSTSRPPKWVTLHTKVIIGTLEGIRLSEGEGFLVRRFFVLWWGKCLRFATIYLCSQFLLQEMVVGYSEYICWRCNNLPDRAVVAE
jgi:hypothetical protein